MDFTDVLKHRRMIRSYSPDPIAGAAVRRIVDAARKAPSAGFSQGQYLLVVTDPDRRKAIARLAAEEDYVAQGMPSWISTAPVHVVVCTSEADYRARYREKDKLNPDGTEIEWPIPYWFVDAGAVMMLLLLAAVDEGLGAGFFGLHRTEGLRDLLQIPADVMPIGIVTIGKPAGEQPKGSAVRGRRPVEQVIRWETWG